MTVAVCVLILSCLIIVPSIVQCVVNHEKGACEKHMYRMLGILSDELNNEAENGGTYWHDMIINGNYQKLMSVLNDKTGESGRYPSSDYYIRSGDEKLSIICKQHKDISEKEIHLSAMRNVNVSVAKRPVFGEKIAFLTVKGADTYYQNDSLDGSNPDKMVFTGKEIDRIIDNLKVTAVYIGGGEKELEHSRYTILADTLDMSRPGQTRLIVKYNSVSVWDSSAYASFIIDVVGEDDVAPLIIDGGINGKFELASWEWNDYVEEASMEITGKEFDASIIKYNGRYYYYPDGLYIENDRKNSDPLNFALDIDDHSKSAYNIEFDTDSVILNSNDRDKIHNGSLRVENDYVYIWQDEPCKALSEGWIRVYCEMNKY